MLGRLKPKAISVIQTPAPGHQGLERLLDLPPFALSLLFSLLLPLPQTLLVSAIAAASLGPGLGLIGAGNVLITAGLSESIVRLGDDARGRHSLPAVAQYYLGPIRNRVAPSPSWRCGSRRWWRACC